LLQKEFCVEPAFGLAQGMSLIDDYIHVDAKKFSSCC